MANRELFLLLMPKVEADLVAILAAANAKLFAGASSKEATSFTVGGKGGSFEIVANAKELASAAFAVLRHKFPATYGKLVRKTHADFRTSRLEQGTGTWPVNYV